MGGSSFAVPRWNREPWLYRDRIFKGSCVDIGGFGDPLAHYRAHLPNITHWTILDERKADFPDVEMLQWDAHTMPPGRTWDVVYSSHCLEHMITPEVVLTAWWPAVAPGGYLVLILPSWEHYERKQWPPQRNVDHRSAWVLGMPPQGTTIPFVSLTALTFHLLGGNLIRALTLDEGFDPAPWDQTIPGTC